MAQKIEMEYVNQYGDKVAKDAPDAAFQINPGDAESNTLIKALKENARPDDYEENLEAVQEQKRQAKEAESKPVSVGSAVPAHLNVAPKAGKK